MKRTNYIYATSYGLVFRFTRANWRKMLETLAAGHEVMYRDYATPVCAIAHNITDLDQETAADLLESLNSTEELV